MEFQNQILSIDKLKDFAKSNRHSILLDGPQGCGKTYLAKLFSDMINVSNFEIISPTVSSIRDAIDSCILLEQPVVLCIENLDTGVIAASYTLLKFLEEPNNNIYIIVTCRNILKIPDTIMSRCTSISVPPPLESDLVKFAKEKYQHNYELYSKHLLWQCMRTFTDVDIFMNLSDVQLDYFDSLRSTLNFSDSVSSLMWKLGHYSDNSETPLELVLRYVMEISNSNYVKRCGIQCIKDIAQSKVASHVALAKFCFDIKYANV